VLLQEGLEFLLDRAAALHKAWRVSPHQHFFLVFLLVNFVNVVIKVVLRREVHHHLSLVRWGLAFVEVRPRRKARQLIIERHREGQVHLKLVKLG